MDSTFPDQLFPGFYYTGPPKKKAGCPVHGWGLYGHVYGTDSGSAEVADWSFLAQRKVIGPTWAPVESIVRPLLPPNSVNKWSSRRLTNALDFPKHMQNFYLYNSEDAFSTMTHLLGDHFNFGSGMLEECMKKTTVSIQKMEHFMSSAKFIKCPLTPFEKRASLYSNLIGDVIHDIPPGLLAELLYDELTLQRGQQQFNEVATGGALGFFPLSTSNTFQEGCLVYPRKAALNSLNFRRVVLEFQENIPRLKVMNKPITYGVNGTIRQVSVGPMEESVYIGVRTDYNCGVWVANSAQKPLPLDVVNTQQRTTCLSVSPHMPGELLVASESGVAYLWTVGRSLQKFREEEENLYFNAKSPWRWCDFSAHPRVMLYADRSGVELTDIRSKETCSHTVFHIGATSGCKSGERVILSRYLCNVNAHHHLVTTQHSAYIMDERFPCLPMVKWNHMMASPPMFAQIVGTASQHQNTVILGSQSSQELMLLQYTGGNAVAAQVLGAPQKLSYPMKSLADLPLQIPHRQKKVQERLSVPAAGITSIYHDKEESLCVLQLSEVGDIFYQILRPASQDSLQAACQEMPNEESVTEQSGSLPRESQESVNSPWTSNVNDGHGTRLLETDGVVSHRECPPETSDVQIHGVNEPGVNMTEQEDVSRSKDKPRPAKVSTATFLMWKSWLNVLCNRQKSTPRYRQLHWTLKTKDHFTFDGTPRDILGKDQITSLRKNMREVMKNQTVLTCGATSLSPPEVLPTPDPVDTQSWGDDLSQRLSVSWEGGWKNWWEEKQGLNREKRIEELRRKRRRLKRARGPRVALSGSFTTSASYQSDMDGWSSAVSDFGSQDPDLDTSTFSGYLSTQEDSTEPERTGRVLQHEPKGSELGSEEQSNVTLSRNKAKMPKDPSQVGKPKAPKQLKQDYMNSLFSSQEEVVDAGMEGTDFFPMSLSSQVSSISNSQRKPTLGPLSQSSQRGKKKARMGF
ncbi:TATA box-binding protein-associated factor, RNA polymerase I, subunit C [Brienomyrus brachyistius]|uniref:TATA box-binding protein-associated factor, RNA polymerase I, subunit C n=1 Tax=Brienomyrus brachyistius TaxID=42636 RepID=UPI0020B3ABFE|nr:TATA box-binding protein-associated factor, RNA polymerase I, subunit C [Brienomyrus brachyistius]